MTRWIRHLYQPGLPLGEDGRRVTGSPEHIELSRRGATEGMVLLKNEDKTLPVKHGAKIALFGKGTVDYVKGGGGSGDVTVKYVRNFYEGMKIKEAEGKVSIYRDLIKFYEEDIKSQYEAGRDPGMTVEPVIPTELLDDAREFADTAIITLCRYSGEGWDRNTSSENIDYLWEGERRLAELQEAVFPKGDYYLTPNEMKMIEDVKSRFDNIIVVLNVGGVMETEWIKNDAKISSALHAWQGGMEGGLAASDLIVGDANPSGKLVDTFARSLEDYPSSYNFHDSSDYAEYTDDIYVGYRYFETIPGAAEKVIYPFGFGLSYTSFEKKVAEFNISDDVITAKVSVKNTGDFAGKEVVMLYYSAPQGVLGKPAKELGAFVKTGLIAPGAEEEVTLTLSIPQMASYDDTGKINKSSWILEKGDYKFFIGNNIRELKQIDQVYSIDEDSVVCELTERIAPSRLTERLRPDGTMEKLETKPYAPDVSILPRMTNQETEGICPCERERKLYHISGRADIMFEDVADGKNTLDEFMAQLSDDDLIHLIGGQKNQGVSNTFGIGNMPEYGVPEISTADGPAGLRILPHVGIYTTAWPCATMLACSFNTELAESIGRATATEVKENNIGIWLAPAVNIHRTPMCGRNFEYYSEDPLVAGKIGAAVVTGVQSQNIASTVKHFAVNNKETNRKNSDSRVSERAAREIYLKPFEIIVREAAPMCIMTAYNKVNGIQCSENEDLINGILREEWGFNGLVMTDWWTSGEHYLEAKAGNDLKMGNGYPDRVRQAYDKGEITHDHLYAAAKHVLELILKME